MRPVSPEDLKKLRAELKCTTRELATAIDVDQATILSWEKGETFPTKQFVERLEAARALGAKAIPRKAKGPAANASPLDLLADPEIWTLFRKLLAHAELRRDVLDLAKQYEAP